MKTRGFLLSAVLIAFAAPLAAQGAQERIDATRAQALQAGVPVELLDAKMAEGKAKGVPLERIAAAMEHRLQVLERAHDALASTVPDLDPGQLSVAADALDQGVSEEVLGELARSAPRDRRAVAIAALTQLVQAGESQERALEQVRAALQRGPDALANLPAAAQEHMRQGGNKGVGPVNHPLGGPPGQLGPGDHPTGPPPTVPARKPQKPKDHGQGHGPPPQS